MRAKRGASKKARKQILYVAWRFSTGGVEKKATDNADTRIWNHKEYSPCQERQ